MEVWVRKIRNSLAQSIALQHVRLDVRLKGRESEVLSLGMSIRLKVIEPITQP